MNEYILRYQHNNHGDCGTVNVTDWSKIGRCITDVKHCSYSVWDADKELYLIYYDDEDKRYIVYDYTMKIWSDHAYAKDAKKHIQLLILGAWYD